MLRSLRASSLLLAVAVVSCGGDDPVALIGPTDAGVGGTAGADASSAGGAAGSSGAAGGVAQGGSSGAAPDASAGGAAGTQPDASSDVSFQYDAPEQDTALTQDSACAAVSVAAQKLPLDIVFLIDNSASMTQEIQSVENNINDNFAAIIGSSGIDYRVIMVSRHGSASASQSICVRSPLSATNCNPIPSAPANNPPIFFHFSTKIASHDPWCKLLGTFNSPDEFQLAPQGWSKWLRQNAIKAFVVMTDDGVYCSYGGQSYNDLDTIAGGEAVAPKFDQALLALSPDQFGTAQDRKYIWYSLACMAANDPPAAAWTPSDPMQAGKCSTSNCPAPGTGYQALSILTGGMRFPLCQYAAFDTVFQAIASGVVSHLACKFGMPTSDGGIINPDEVALEFTPGAGPKQKLGKVADPSQCTADGWYYDDPADPTQIQLCPDACAKVKADTGGKIDVLFGCLGS